VTSFASYEDLHRLGLEGDPRDLLARASDPAGKTVFLSHSSKDNDLLPGVIRILESNGGRVYVDVKDAALPQGDFVGIASRLRNAVKTCRKFVLLVSQRTNCSAWIPWELGLGDGKNHDENVALFPSAEKHYEQEWSKQEFLGLYRRIIWGNFKDMEAEWLVYDHRTNAAQRLRDWLA